MKLTVAEIEQIRELVLMKMGTYHSRIMDLIAHCQHPQNLLSVANKFGRIKNKDVEDLEVFRSLLVARLHLYRMEILTEIEEAKHPHELVDVARKLDRLIEDCY